MKKLTLIALLGFVSTTAFAAPVGSTFTGFGTGIDLTSTKYEGAKRATGVGIAVDYGFDYGSNFVGLVEGKVKLNSSKLVDESHKDFSVNVSEKWRASVSYLQGYRVLPDLLPYVKIAYTLTQFKGNETTTGESYSSEISNSETKSGIGFGAGVKYAVSSNVELGAEYLRTRTKLEGGNVNGNTFGANVTYRF